MKDDDTMTPQVYLIQSGGVQIFLGVDVIDDDLISFGLSESTIGIMAYMYRGGRDM
jgi:hypothetical protein